MTNKNIKITLWVLTIVTLFINVPVALLFLISAIIYGKRHPDVNSENENKKTEKTTSLVKILIVILVIGILSSVVLASLNTARQKGLEVTKNNEIKKEVGTIFDVNSLYGKNIDEVIAILGKPKFDTEPTKLQIEMGTKEWDKTFEKDGRELLVTYYVGSRKVKDFFMATSDPSGFTKDTEIIKAEMGLVNSNKFIFKSVNALKDPSVYTGLIATPQN